MSIVFHGSSPVLALTALTAGVMVVLGFGISSHVKPRVEQCVMLTDQANFGNESVYVVNRDNTSCEILDFDFGTFAGDTGQVRMFTRTAEFPFKLEQEYGWRMKVENNGQPVDWVEILTVPSPPKTWGGPSIHRKVTHDRRTCYTHYRELPTADGWLENSWKVADGDPKGTYSLTVIVDGVERKTVQFEVE